MEPLLQVHNLSVHYEVRRSHPVRVLSDISFDLASGDAVGLLGESGSGKTTLSLALLRLLPKTARVAKGAIIFRGTNLLESDERELQRIRGAGISLVHQEPGLVLNPVLRVGDQIAEVLRAHRDLSARKAWAMVKKLLAQVGLDGDSNIDAAFPHQLSGGQRQRVVIAQAIACGPALLIADEPTTALDAAVQLEILALLRDLQARLRLGLILITHDPAVLLSTAQRILVMYAGRIVEDGPAHQVLHQPAHPFTKALLQCRSAASLQGAQTRFTAIPDEPPNLAALPAGCAFAPRCPERMDVCDSRRPVETHLERARRVWCC